MSKINQRRIGSVCIGVSLGLIARASGGDAIVAAVVGALGALGSAILADYIRN